MAAREVLLSIPAVSNLIREGKTFQIPSIMQTNRKAGMVTLNDALLELVDAKQVEPKEAYMKAVEKTGLRGGVEGQAASPVSFLGEWRNPELSRLAVRPPILVLVSPQDIVNIAGAVRLAKNFGIERMRLVNPEVFDP